MTITLFSTTETILTMDKPKKKKPEYNQDAIKALVDKYGYGSYYIRQCVSGNKQGLFPDQVQKEYGILCKKIDDAKKVVIETYKTQ